MKQSFLILVGLLANVPLQAVFCLHNLFGIEENFEQLERTYYLQRHYSELIINTVKKRQAQELDMILEKAKQHVTQKTFEEFTTSALYEMVDYCKHNNRVTETNPWFSNQERNDARELVIATSLINQGAKITEVILHDAQLTCDEKVFTLIKKYHEQK